MAHKPLQKNKEQKHHPVTIWDQATRIPLVYLIFLVIAFLIYGQALHFYLGKLDEDILILTKRDFLRDLHNLGSAMMSDAYLSDKGTSFYRPLQTFTYMIDANFFFTRGSVFYFTNIIIHIFTCSALFHLLVLLADNRKAAFIFSLLYLCSPLFVHAIAWAPSRGDLLIGLTGILSLVFFIKMTSTGKFKFGICTMIAFFAAMFSKETAIFIPLIILLYYLTIVKNKRATLPSAIITFGGFLLIILFYFFVRSKVIVFSTPSSEFGMIPFFHNLRTLPEFIAKFFIPVFLSPMPGFTLLNTILGIIVLCCLAGFAIRLSASHWKKLVFGLLWFLVFAIPGMMYCHKYGGAAYDYLEHRAYLPMAGIVILLYFIYNSIQNSRLQSRAGNIILFLTVVSAIYSFFYTVNYEDPMVFYDRAVKSNPSSAVAFHNRGCVKLNLNDYQGAIADYEKALTIKHDYSEAYINKGRSLDMLNDKYTAIAMYDSALRYDPGQFQAHFHKAGAQMHLGLYAEAIRGYNKVIELVPAYVPAYTARGSAYFFLKNPEAAINDFNTAIKLNNKNAVAYLLRGKIRFTGNDHKGACADWHIATSLGNSEAMELLSKFCKQ